MILKYRVITSMLASHRKLVAPIRSLSMLCIPSKVLTPDHRILYMKTYVLVMISDLALWGVDISISNVLFALLGGELEHCIKLLEHCIKLSVVQ